MKKAGIGVDNYKLKKFEEELKANGFTDYKVSPLTKDSSFISVMVSDESKYADINRICKRVELHFKHSN